MRDDGSVIIIRIPLNKTTIAMIVLVVALILAGKILLLADLLNEVKYK